MKMKTVLIAAVCGLVTAPVFAGQLLVERNGVTETIEYEERVVVVQGLACESMDYLKLGYTHIPNIPHFIGTNKCALTIVGDSYKVIADSEFDTTLELYLGDGLFFRVPKYVFTGL